MKLRISKHINELGTYRYVVEGRLLGFLMWVGVDDYGCYWNRDGYSEYATHPTYGDAEERRCDIINVHKASKWRCLK